MGLACMQDMIHQVHPVVHVHGKLTEPHDLDHGATGCRVKALVAQNPIDQIQVGQHDGRKLVHWLHRCHDP